MMQFVKNFFQYISKGGIVEVKIATPMSFNDKPLEGKSALITGGTAGIGLSIAECLNESGANIVITGRNYEKLKSIEHKMNNCKSVVWDISNTTIANHKMNECWQAFGQIDILINNVGIYDGTDIFDVTEETYNNIMNTNVRGTYFCTQAFVKKCASNNYQISRRIINILSIRSLTSDTNVYSLSKWAELCLTKGLAKELLNKNIIVNAVAPGPTVSNINGLDSNGNLYNPSGINTKYFLQPIQIANVVKFLACDFSNGIVGQTIVVDGGETLK